MSHPLFDLSGQKALVTGAGRGIGATLALGLAQAGADVAIADIDLAPADEGRRAIEALERRCPLIEADVTDRAGAERMVAEASAALGGLTILVNNAGTNVRKTMAEVTEEDWDRVLDLNLKSLFFITRRAGDEMKKAGGGKVINMASLMGWSVFRNPHGQTYGPYASSKGGILQLTRTLALEWAGSGITAHCIWAPSHRAVAAVAGGAKLGRQDHEVDGEGGGEVRHAVELQLRRDGDSAEP